MYKMIRLAQKASKHPADEQKVEEEIIRLTIYVVVELFNLQNEYFKEDFL